jgi:hypothetical protein
VALAQTDPAVVSPTPSPANTVQTNAATVAANAPIAAYNNPAVAGNWRHDALADTLIAGQLNEVYISRLSGSVSQLNTNYVLDGAKNLVEIRNSTYEYWDPNGNPLFLSNADIRFTGGVAQDTYQLPDGSIYLGRWQGGGIAVTDLSATAPLAPFTDNLGVSSTHWVRATQETSPGKHCEIASGYGQLQYRWFHQTHRQNRQHRYGNCRYVDCKLYGANCFLCGNFDF